MRHVIWTKNEPYHMVKIMDQAVKTFFIKIASRPSITGDLMGLKLRPCRSNLKCGIRTKRPIREDHHRRSVELDGDVGARTSVISNNFVISNNLSPKSKW